MFDKRHYTPEMSSFIKHLRNNIDFLVLNSLYLTTKSILIEIYKLFCLAIIGYDESKPIRVNGSVMFTIPRDRGISLELLAFGTHEPISSRLLPLFLEEDMTCLEIGANIGYYALIEAKGIGETGKLVLVEPSDASIKCLTKNLAVNNISNYVLKKVAIADKNGFTNFIFDSRSNLSRINYGKTTGPSVHIVKTQTIDSLVEELALKRVDLIRMDVEGAEALINKGWTKTIANFQPLLFIEIHRRRLGVDRVVQFLSSLADAGYKDTIFINRSLNSPMLIGREGAERTTLEGISQRLLVKGIPKDDFHIITGRPNSGIWDKKLSE